MKKLLKFRPKKNTPYPVVNTQGVLLTLTSEDFLYPLRLANFWDKKFVGKGELPAVMSRGDKFYTAFFSDEIVTDGGVNINIENWYRGLPQECVDLAQEILSKAQKCLIEVVDTRNPDIVLSVHSFDCNFSGGYHILGLENMRIPEFPKLF